MSKKALNEDQKYRLSHWFTRVDNNTIELKERRWGAVKIALFVFLFLSYSYNSIRSSDSSIGAIDMLKFTFMPSTRFEDVWNDSRDKDNPNLSRWGETEQEFKAEMWENTNIMFGMAMSLLCLSF